MKRSSFSRLASIALAAAFLWGCTSPTGGSGSDSSADAAPGSGSVGGTDSAKITFETTTTELAGSSAWAYSPGTALTTTSTDIVATVANDYFYAGAASMKLTGTLQQDKYDYVSGTSTLNSPAKTIEMGIRVKLKEGSGGSTTTYDLTDKIVSMAVYLPTGATNTAFQVALQDSANQQAISAAVTLTPGKWTKLYFKADSNYVNASGKLKLTTVDADYAYVANGVYSSNTFDATAVSQIELRSLGDVNKASVGAAATVYVDSLSWTNTAYGTKAAAPTFNLTSGNSYSTTQSLTLASTTTGAAIYYTFTSNGDTPEDPTSSSTLYNGAISLPTTGTTATTYKVKAIAIASGLTDSAISSGTFIIDPSLITYTVTFSANGQSAATNLPTSLTVNNGNTITEPTTTPTLSGYWFEGWYKDAAGTTAWTFASDTVTADTTLYAKWGQIVTMTLSSATLGGSGGVASSTPTYNSDGSATYTAQYRYGGGGLNFFVNAGKTAVALTSYKKIVVSYTATPSNYAQTNKLVLKAFTTSTASFWTSTGLSYADVAATSASTATQGTITLTGPTTTGVYALGLALNSSGYAGDTDSTTVSTSNDGDSTTYDTVTITVNSIQLYQY